MRRSFSFLLVLWAAPTLFAADDDKPVGRTLEQRFGKLDQSLVFDPQQGAVGQGKSFYTRNAQSSSFHFDQKVAPTKFATQEYSQPKSSWLSKLKFWAKDANTKGAHEIPNAAKSVETNAASVKDARDAGKTVAVRDASGSSRVYLGPERAKLDRAVDPSKPLPAGYTGKLDTLTLEQVRELLNKNK
jgi:hypothetical protein